MSSSKVSVVFDGHEVLRFDGKTAQVQVIPIDARLQVAAALSRAAALFIARLLASGERYGETARLNGLAPRITTRR